MASLDTPYSEVWEPATPSAAALVTDNSNVQVTETENAVLFLVIITLMCCYGHDKVYLK